MTVPIVWLSYRQPEICARGTWDTDQFTLIADREWWTPADALEYRHVIGFDGLSPDDDGAVVIIGAQHHARPDYVRRLNTDLARLRWVVLVLAGDECSLFSWELVQHPNMRLWIMTPQPQIHADADAYFVGEGYNHAVPGLLRSHAVTWESAAGERPWAWHFAGQVTHRRREEMMAALRRCPAPGLAKGTPGFLQGDPLPAYLGAMASAKVVPCPSGPCTPDSFRFYEALESGCVPIADAYTPAGWPGYWQFVYGTNLPFPVIENWRDLPAIMGAVLDEWDERVRACSAWWQATKVRMVQRLDDDVRAVRDSG